MELTRANSVVAMLDHWANVQPEKVYARFLGDGTNETEAWTFAEMRQRALTLAQEISRVAKPGDRAILVYPQGLEFIAAFFGCQYAGVIAVPVIPPASPKFIPKLFKIIQDCEPSCILTTAELRDQLVALGNAAAATSDISPFGNLPAMTHATDKIATRKTDFRGPHISREDLALLQYTSGSTGFPKGVMVTQGNLLTNQGMIYRGFGMHQNTVHVSWAPHYHDMGLVGGVLIPSTLGSTLVLMSPISFVANPPAWLHAVTKYRGTLMGGPNFGYELCVKRTTDDELARIDLSTIVSAYNGAEPIRASTLEKFTARFRSSGFNPQSWHCCYGLAESTLLVSGGGNGTGIHLGKSGTDNKLTVQSGEIFPNQTVVIASLDTHGPAAGGKEGEIWVAGDHVAKGYWGRPAETLQTFSARISSDDQHLASKRYLRTGDLGIIENNQLTVMSRIKDLIIHNGRNLYPQDIEELIEQTSNHIRRGCVIAFSLEGEDESEGVGLVAEVDKTCPNDLLPQIGATIHAAAASQFAIPVLGVALIRSGTLPKTSSGKLQRRETRTKFLQKSLDFLWSLQQPAEAAPVTQGRTATARRPRQTLGVDSAVVSTQQSKQRSSTNNNASASVEHFMREWLAQVTNQPVDDVDPTRALASYNLDSVAAVEFQVAVKKEFGIEVPERALFEFDSTKGLANFLSKKLQQAS